MTQNSNSQKANYIAGAWKFQNKLVSEEEITILANEWAKDDLYTQIFYRSGGNDQTALCFVRKFDGAKKSSEEYFDKTSDSLKRRFGNGLIGWDVTGGITIIKGNLD